MTSTGKLDLKKIKKKKLPSQSRDEQNISHDSKRKHKNKEHGDITSRKKSCEVKILHPKKSERSHNISIQHQTNPSLATHK
jgi:DNA-binding TFAR19-related protein (PDSD5 family)